MSNYNEVGRPPEGGWYNRYSTNKLRWGFSYRALRQWTRVEVLREDHKLSRKELLKALTPRIGLKYKQRQVWKEIVFGRARQIQEWR